MDETTDRRKIYMNTLAGFTLPVLQAIGAGVIVGLLAFSLAILGRIEKPWAVGLAFGLLAMLVSWMLTMAAWHGAVYGPQVVIEQPAALPAETGSRLMIVNTETTTTGVFVELPDIQPDRLQVLAAGLLAGRTFATSTWCGKHGTFTRHEFEQLRSVLIERGLIYWLNPRSRNLGVDLTPSGRACMRWLARLSGDVSAEIEA